MRNYRILVLLQERFIDIIFTTPIVIFIIKLLILRAVYAGMAPQGGVNSLADQKAMIIWKIERGLHGFKKISADFKIEYYFLDILKLVERPDKSGPRLMSRVLKIIEENR